MAWIQAERGHIPAVPGCYVVFERHRAIYVGSTINLAARLTTYRRLSRPVLVHGGHRIDRRLCTPWPEVSGEDVTIKYKTSQRKGDWLMLEYRLINRLQPQFNRSGVTSGRVGLIRG